jgi:hypothetical protein
MVELGEPRFPSRGRRQAIDQLGGPTSEHLLHRYDRRRQLPGRPAEEGTGAEWCELHADARLSAVVGDADRPAVQARRQRGVRRRRLGGIRHRGDLDRRTEADDERQVARRQPAVDAGREAIQVVADVPVDAAAQGR